LTVVAAPPEGFQVAIRGRSTFIARGSSFEALREAGLDRTDGWDRWTGGKEAQAGRGATAALKLHDGSRLRLKQLRRGGALAPLWFERFSGSRRLLDNLRIPLAAAGRGVVTPSPVVLLLEQGPPGLFRGWLGTEEIEGAFDLAARFGSGRTLERGELQSAMNLVRKMHDVGLDHRDLNLGNLLLQDEGAGRSTVWVCDLDGARLLAAPVDFESRQRALRRLERSYVKVCAPGKPSQETRDDFYRLYAAGDRSLAERLERGRSAGRGWIFLHRMGWRR
jgi:hypothetical protein